MQVQQCAFYLLFRSAVIDIRRTYMLHKSSRVPFRPSSC